MEIGKPKRKYTIEPLRDPVPRERRQRPVRVPAAPVKKPPARVGAYPEALYVPASPTHSSADALAVAEGLERRYEVPVELIEPWRPKDVARTIADAEPLLMR